MTYNLVEIFESLQGEGRNFGRPCVFVRFANCNLNCPWCDTDRSGRFRATVDELVREIASMKPKSVVLTGGEPAVVSGMEELVARLKKSGYWLAIETNGTVNPPWIQFLDYVAVSPKIEFENSYDPSSMIREANEVRIVASQGEDTRFFEKMRSLISADDYYVSPCECNGEFDFATAKALVSKLEGWSLSVQMHKILGFR